MYVYFKYFGIYVANLAVFTVKLLILKEKIKILNFYKIYNWKLKINEKALKFDWILVYIVSYLILQKESAFLTFLIKIIIIFCVKMPIFA